jgi:hypothetical protein
LETRSHELFVQAGNFQLNGITVYYLVKGFLFLELTQGWAWWFISVILTISDVEIMRIAVQGQPWQKD